jgi:hypothetical protein
MKTLAALLQKILATIAPLFRLHDTREMEARVRRDQEHEALVGQFLLQYLDPALVRKRRMDIDAVPADAPERVFLIDPSGMDLARRIGWDRIAGLRLVSVTDS